MFVRSLLMVLVLQWIPGAAAAESIFLDEETLTLFAVQKLADGHTADSLPNHPIVREWWDFMADIMELNPDHSPVCKPLIEVFHAP